MQIQINQEEWSEWIIHPVTQDFFRALKLGAEEVKEQLASQGISPEQTEFLRGIYYNLKDITSLERKEEE